MNRCFGLLTDLTPFRFLSGNPIPLIPLPLDKGKGNQFVLKRGVAPLILPSLFSEKASLQVSLFKMERGKSFKKRGVKPLLNSPDK